MLTRQVMDACGVVHVHYEPCPDCGEHGRYQGPCPGDRTAHVWDPALEVCSIAHEAQAYPENRATCELCACAVCGEHPAPEVIWSNHQAQRCRACAAKEAAGGSS